MDPPEGQHCIRGEQVSLLGAGTFLPLQVLSTLAGRTSGCEQREGCAGADAAGRRITIEFNFFPDDCFPIEGWFIDDVSLLVVQAVKSLPKVHHKCDTLPLDSHDTPISIPDCPVAGHQPSTRGRRQNSHCGPLPSQHV